MNFLELTKDKLDLNKISDLVSHESCGAISFFVGTTRDNFEDKKVVKLEYEAYDSMALKAMTSICDTIREKWPDTKHIAIYHRLGVVPVKESSIIIAISSPHRQESLGAVQFAIDDVKTKVPIWKKEFYGDENEDSSLPRKRQKRAKVNINYACCPIENEVVVPKEMLQIRADEQEINRRVNCFIERKRKEIDLNNIEDFIEKNEKVENDDSCARVYSSVYRIKGAKAHLPTDRVKNEEGPQTSNYKTTLNKLMSESSPVKTKTEIEGVEERLNNVEHFLNTTSETRKSIFERLKYVEDRITFLETVSPEYNHFWKFNTRKNDDNITQESMQIKKEKKIFSSVELDQLIQKLETKSA